MTDENIIKGEAEPGWRISIMFIQKFINFLFEKEVVTGITISFFTESFPYFGIICKQNVPES